LRCWHVRLRHHPLTIMAADMAAVAGMAMLAAGMEEAVIRAALAGMALALAGMAVAVTGTAVAGIMVVTVVAGELAPQ
jgi:hypothetical protein